MSRGGHFRAQKKGEAQETHRGKGEERLAFSNRRFTKRKETGGERSS